MRPLTFPLIACLCLAVAMPAGAASSASSKSAAKKKSSYGAIAWHRASGNYGYSHDLTTTREAGTEALRQCGHPQCEVVLSLHNECGALSASPKAFAARRGFTEAEARAKADSACGPGCRPVAWACTK